MMSDSARLRLATRASALAMAQSRTVAGAVERANPGLAVEIVPVTTSGDRIQDRPLHELGGKGLFTREVELALLRGEADIAVHSFKDVPVTMPLVPEAAHALVIGAVPAREDPRDVLVSRRGGGVSDLPTGARIGTSSLRRRAQILALRPDVEVLALRGNVDTRLARLEAGEMDAMLLAMAGLVRLGRFSPATMRPLPVDDMTPAAGQGALAIQCRRDDARAAAALAPLDDGPTRRCAEVERALVAALEGDCTSPIGALARESEPGRFALAGCYERSGRLARAEATGEAAEVVARVRDALLAG